MTACARPESPRDDRRPPARCDPRSWLLDLTAAALRVDNNLSEFAGRVSDSGEGRWTLRAAIDEGVPAPVLSAALFGRFESRGAAEYADKLMSAMRLEFGGHHEKTTGARMKAAASDAIVLFGATGDLAYKQIFPALQGRITSPGARSAIPASRSTTASRWPR